MLIITTMPYAVYKYTHQTEHHLEMFMTKQLMGKVVRSFAISIHTGRHFNAITHPNMYKPKWRLFWPAPPSSSPPNSPPTPFYVNYLSILCTVVFSSADVVAGLSSD